MFELGFRASQEAQCKITATLLFFCEKCLFCNFRKHPDEWTEFQENEQARLDIENERKSKERDRSAIRQFEPGDEEVVFIGQSQQLTAQIPQKKLEPFVPWSFENVKQQEAMSLLAEWIAAAGMPYSCIENQSFDRFVNFLNKNFQVPSEKTIRTSIIPEMHAKVRSLVLSLIDRTVCKCSFTIDFWSSKSAHAFMSFAIHFITDRWKRKVVTLECLLFDE